MNPMIIAAATYIVLMPILLRLVGVAHTKLVINRQLQKMPKTRAAAANLPQPIWPPMKEKIVFALKDKRPFNEKKQEGISVKKMFWLVWAVGLAGAVIGASIGNVWLAVLSHFVFFGAIVMGMNKAKPILEGRKKITTKAVEIAKKSLGVDPANADNPSAVFQVLEWRETLKPSKVEFNFPITFNADQSESFLKAFNQAFGVETTWVADNDQEKGPGWDFEEGKVRLREMPPLPQMAPWSEHYVLDPSVAWSFFPLALGVENGIELTNPKTGETENVLGFDLSGEQPSLSKKLGTYCSPTITTSPMVLCLTGETLIELEDGTYERIDSLATKRQAVVKTLENDGSVGVRRMFSIRMTRANAQVVKVTFADGSQVRATPDHEFMLADGSYAQAITLTPESKLAPVNGVALQVASVTPDGSADVYDGEVEETHNFIVGVETPNKQYKVVRLVSSNCAGGTGGGKSCALDTAVVVLQGGAIAA